MGELLNKSDLNWNSQHGISNQLGGTDTVIERNSDENNINMTIEENSEIHDDAESLEQAYQTRIIHNTE